MQPPLPSLTQPAPALGASLICDSDLRHVSPGQQGWRPEGKPGGGRVPLSLVAGPGDSPWGALGSLGIFAPLAGLGSPSARKRGEPGTGEGTDCRP